jgi:hypothetical protein
MLLHYSVYTCSKWAVYCIKKTAFWDIATCTRWSTPTFQKFVLRLSSPWWRRQYAPLKRSSTSTRLHRQYSKYPHNSKMIRGFIFYLIHFIVLMPTVGTLHICQFFGQSIQNERLKRRQQLPGHSFHLQTYLTDFDKIWNWRSTLKVV